MEQASGNLTAKFIGNGRQPQCAPDPAYPDGKPVDASMGRASCAIELEHPAKECGFWVISCSLCGVRLAVTAAARADDPSLIRLPCEPMAGSA
jgi:hypothetical protein